MFSNHFMPLFPLSALWVFIPFALLAWLGNKWLQQWIQPRKTILRLFTYLGAGMLLLFAGVYLAVRLVLWLWPPQP
jgi:MFS superfamily sulfate permease-like transporter